MFTFRPFWAGVEMASLKKYLPVVCHIIYTNRSELTSNSHMAEETYFTNESAVI